MINTGETFRILGIAGSPRRDSSNRRLLAAAADVAPRGVTLEIADLASMPFYNGDVEAAGDPPAGRAFKEQIRSTDALLIATPEYNGTVPGVLQNAIDWASRPRDDSALAGKPIAVMGASPSPRGTVRSRAVPRHVLANTRARVKPEPELLVSHAADRFMADGLLIDDQIRQELTALLLAPRRWAAEARGDDSAAA